MTMTTRMTTTTILAAVVLVVVVLLSPVVPVASAVEVETGNQGAYSGRVLLVSMDGFRWDYIQKVSGLGNFSRLAASGCSVDYVEAAFATKTFPCHYTIATGLYEENHGIVANRMYDPVHNASFNKRSTESFWWDGGEPLWVTAERQNKSTGVYFWVGSEAKIRGYRPSTYLPYNQSVPFPERVQTVMNWFKTGGKDLVMLYFHEPDYTGHRYGPDSPQVADKVREMDGILGLILNSMEEMDLKDVNVIITADHGMTGIDVQNRLLNLWDYVNESWVEIVPDSSTVTPILPKAGLEQQVLEAARRIPHVTVYRKEEIPEHFHYRDNVRIMPIVILSDEGWLLSTKYEKVLEENEKGDHGYSNQLPSMRAIFFARGPHFQQDVKKDLIRAVDIYPLVCRLLNIQPSPNNGSLATTTQFLVNRADHTAGCGAFSWLCVGLFVMIAELFRM